MLLNGFVTSQGRNCILGNVHNTINYSNIKTTEQDLFFWFSPFDGDENLPQVFEKLYENKGKFGWQEFVKKSLNDGQPAMLSITPKVLPYIKVEVGDCSAKHYINIIGIEEDRKKLYVSDSYVPTFIPSTYEGWVDYSAITDSDIGNCWRLKPEMLLYFKDNCKLHDINNFTLAYIIKRLSAFLSGKSENQYLSGIDNLRLLIEIVRNGIENEKYDDIYKLLAGIRLNVINPLIYLINVFERCPDKYSKWIEKLNTLVNCHWEKLYVKLVKYALTHKKLDANRISEQIYLSIELEGKMLNDLLKQLLDTKKYSTVTIPEFLR